MSGSFLVDLKFSGSGFWEDVKMTQPYFCIFVIISPLKGTQPFVWTKLNPLHDLHLVWLKLAQWFWFIWKTLIPHCGPILPQGALILTNLNRSCHINLNFSGPVVLEKDIVFRHTQQFFSYLVASSFYWWRRVLRYNVPGERPLTFQK